MPREWTERDATTAYGLQDQVMRRAVLNSGQGERKGEEFILGQALWADTKRWGWPNLGYIGRSRGIEALEWRGESSSENLLGSDNQPLSKQWKLKNRAHHKER
jgi:hypothetical protein